MLHFNIDEVAMSIANVGVWRDIHLYGQRIIPFDQHALYDQYDSWNFPSQDEINSMIKRKKFSSEKIYGNVQKDQGWWITSNLFTLTNPCFFIMFPQTRCIVQEGDFTYKRQIEYEIHFGEYSDQLNR